MRGRVPLAELNPRRVCIIKPSALGDVVQTLPVLAGLKARWPDAEFSWVVNRPLAGLLEPHPDLHEVLLFDRRQKTWGGWFSSQQRLVRELRSRRFDVVIDLQGLFRTGVLTWLSGAPRRVGLSCAREGATLAYTDHIHVPTLDMPALDRYWLLVKALGGPANPLPAVVPIGPEQRQWVAHKLAGLPRPWLAIQPGSQWETKRWPTASFAAIARRAIQTQGGSIVVLGGPGEEPLALDLAMQLEGIPLVNVAGSTSLLQLAALLDTVDVVLSGDTGPMHLADALRTELVALFTCTSPLRAGPRGPGSRVVATQVECAASYIKRCPHCRCMQELSVARVWPAVAAALLATKSRAA